MKSDADEDNDEDIATVIASATRITSLVRLLVLKRRRRLQKEVNSTTTANRQSRIHRDPPVKFNSMMSTLVAEGAFYQEIGLKPEGFQHLLSLILPALIVDMEMASIRTENAPLDPGERLYATLRYLKGGVYADIRRERAISKSQFYKIRDQVLLAICQCEAIQIALPSEAQAAVSKKAFMEFSKDKVFHRCRAVMDGWLFTTHAPWKKEDPNQLNYFSGSHLLSI
jgi:hypothetical protein